MDYTFSYVFCGLRGVEEATLNKSVQTPQSLNLTDALTFNITLLLPQSDPSPRYIPQLLCHLPHFQHTYGQLDPYITFDSVIFGGAMSGVYVEVRNLTPSVLAWD